MIPPTKSPQDPNIRAFFETHNSTKVNTLPEMTEEMFKDLSSQTPSILAQPPILTRVFTTVGLDTHRASMNTLLSCVYQLKCKKCKISPVVFQAGTYHPERVNSLFEDRTINSSPLENQLWEVPEEFHFLLKCRCPQCNDTFFSLATYLPEIGSIINSNAMSAARLKNAFKVDLGFIAQYSWISSYFENKDYDRTYEQKTALACIQIYRDLKKACKIRRLPKETFQKEVTEGILDVIRNLIPQICTEKEFFGLIKGAYLFVLMYIGDAKYQFKNLDPLTTQFSFAKLKQEYRSVEDRIPYEEKKMCLTTAILSVDIAYQFITPSTIAIPEKVGEESGLD